MKAFYDFTNLLEETIYINSDNLTEKTDKHQTG